VEDLSVQEANILNLLYFGFPLMLYLTSDVVVVSDSYHLQRGSLVEGYCGPSFCHCSIQTWSWKPVINIFSLNKHCCSYNLVP